MASELRKVLETLKYMAETSGRTEDLVRDLGVSVNTLRRRVEELRHLGAQVEAVRTRGAKVGTWSYEVKNWGKLRPMVEKWFVLEAEQEKVGVFETVGRDR